MLTALTKAVKLSFRLKDLKTRWVIVEFEVTEKKVFSSNGVTAKATFTLELGKVVLPFQTARTRKLPVASGNQTASYAPVESVVVSVMSFQVAPFVTL